MSPILLGGETLNYAFCCDDSRVEDTGKFLFVGVYSTDVVLRTLPAHIVQRCVAQCVTMDSPQQDMLFRIRAGDEVQGQNHLNRDPQRPLLPRAYRSLFRFYQCR